MSWPSIRSAVSSSHGCTQPVSKPKSPTKSTNGANSSAPTRRSHPRIPRARPTGLYCAITLTFDVGFLKEAFPDLPTQPVALGGETNVETAPQAFPIHTLKIGEAELRRFVGMALPLGHLSEAVGVRVDGILGMNALGYAPFRLSLADGAVTWFSAPPVPQGALPLPLLDVADNSFHAVATRAGDETTFPVLLDSGASLTFMDGAHWPAGEGEARLGAAGVNAAQDATFKRGAPGTLRLGALSLPLEPLLRDGEEPLLGADALRGLDLIIDAKARKAWALPRAAE